MSGVPQVSRCDQVAVELVVGGPEGEGRARDGPVKNVPPFLVKTALRVVATPLRGATSRSVTALLHCSICAQVASSVWNRAGFDLYKCRPIDAAPACQMPALVATALSDTLVRPHHSKCISAALGGENTLVNFPGDHNTGRPASFLHAASAFLATVLALSPEEELQVPRDAAGHVLPLMQAIAVGRRSRLCAATPASAKQRGRPAPAAKGRLPRAGNGSGDGSAAAGSAQDLLINFE